jgi:hypothetical protein
MTAGRDALAGFLRQLSGRLGMLDAQGQMLTFLMDNQED